MTENIETPRAVAPSPAMPAVTGSALLGIGMMLLGIFLFVVNDVMGKWLVATYSVGQVLLVRSLAAHGSPGADDLARPALGKSLRRLAQASRSSASFCPPPKLPHSIGRSHICRWPTS